jgi:peptide deformylase
MKAVNNKEFFEKSGIFLLPLAQLSDTIESVADPKGFAEKHEDEILWCMEVLRRTGGYGIALPQIGLNYNGCVLRDGGAYHVMFNLEVEGVPLRNGNKPAKSRRRSKEFSYSVEEAKIPFIVKRWKKIKAYWTDVEGMEVGKSFRYPDKCVEPPKALILQHLYDVVSGEYKEKMGLILNSPENTQFNIMKSKRDKMLDALSSVAQTTELNGATSGFLQVDTEQNQCKSV